MPRCDHVGDTVARVSSPARRPVTDDEGKGEGQVQGKGQGRRSPERIGDVEGDRTAQAARALARPPFWLAWPYAARVWFANWRTSRGAVDTAVCVFYLAVAGGLTHGLWPDPATRAITENVNDQALIEWFLAHGVLVWQGDFSFVTDRLNSPDGVNLMSNASHILHGVLMAPVTVVFGAAVSFALLVALNLAATAAGWYLLLARGFGLHRGAAIVGGLFAGFAPGMISQSLSHLHMTAQWLVPAIVWCLVRLTRVRTAWEILRTALALSTLIFAQVLLGEEVLYLTALTVALFGLVYAAIRWRWTRRVAPDFLAGVVLAAVVS